ncbi:MAG: hypothetical protein ACRCYX_13305 [Dermatophilaceae bacterium]
MSLDESNISAGDMVEGYVMAADVDAVLDGYLLSPASRSRANVVLHVVHHQLDLDIDLGVAVRYPLLLAADLAEHDGVRERAESVRAASDLARSIGAADA